MYTSEQLFMSYSVDQYFLVSGTQIFVGKMMSLKACTKIVCDQDIYNPNDVMFNLPLHKKKIWLDWREFLNPCYITIYILHIKVLNPFTSRSQSKFIVIFFIYKSDSSYIPSTIALTTKSTCTFNNLINYINNKINMYL